MARLFNDASSEYLTVTSVPVASLPMTFACWFYTDEATAEMSLVVENDGAPGAIDSLGINVDSGNVRASSVATQIPRHATTSTTYSTNTWHHAAGVFTSTTSRAAYLDGGGKGTNTNSNSATGFNRVDIAGLLVSGFGTFTHLSGRIAEVAIWNVALTDAEVASLAAGFTPPFVRPQSLVAYWPLIRDEDQDRVGGYDLTPVNTPSIAAHVPIIYPSRGLGGFTATAAAGGAQDADFALDFVTTTASGALAGSQAAITLLAVTDIAAGALAATSAGLALDAIALLANTAEAGQLAALSLDVVPGIDTSAQAGTVGALSLNVITATDISAQATATAALDILQALGIDTSAIAATVSGMTLDAILALAISSGQSVTAAFALDVIPSISDSGMVASGGGLSLNFVPSIADSGTAATLGNLSLDTVLSFVNSTGQSISVNLELNFVPGVSESAASAAAASLSLDAQVTIDMLATAASLAGFEIGAVYGIGVNTVVEVITPDGRIYAILAENRVYQIAADSRVSAIGQEVRTLAISED